VPVSKLELGEKALATDSKEEASKGVLQNRSHNGLAAIANFRPGRYFCKRRFRLKTFDVRSYILCHS
jgi:hypothetical protein